MAGVVRAPGDRGQLLLVGALTLAVLLVVLAIALNSAVYAGVVATEERGGTDDRTALDARADAERGVSDLLATVNANNSTSSASATAAVADGVGDLDALLARQWAPRGASTSVTLLDTVNSTRVVQDEARNFTNRSGSANWTLGTDVPAAESAELTVERSALAGPANGSCTPASGCYALVASNGSATWRLYVYNDSGDITVQTVNASGGERTCGVSNETARINVTGGTLAGDPCPGLSFAEGVEAPYDLHYRDGDAVAGTYAVEVATAVPADPHYTATGSPRLEPTVTEATIRFGYRTPDLRYDATLRVAGGDHRD